MDLATILGIIISFGLVLMAILSSGSIFIFIDVPSLMIVIGGTFGCCFTNYPIYQVIRIIGIIKKTFAWRENAHALSPLRQRASRAHTVPLFYLYVRC